MVRSTTTRAERAAVDTIGADSREAAARERLGRLEAFFAAEEHLAEEAVDVLLGGIGIELVQPVHSRQTFLDRTRVVLREVADRHLVSPPDRARVDVCRWPQRRVGGGEEGFEERGLAQPVPADEDDLLAAVDDGAEVRHDRG